MKIQAKTIDYIKDYMICGQDFYFVSDRDVPYETVRRDLHAGPGTVLHRLPDLLNMPEPDRYPFNSACIGNIRSALETAGIGDFLYHLSFLDRMPGFDRSKMAPPGTQTARAAVSERKARLTGEDLDWGRLSCRSLADLIWQRRRSRQEIIYLDHTGEKRETIAELFERAFAMASAFGREGIDAGTQVIFQFRNNETLTACFWACMMTGAAAVPVEVLKDFSSKNMAADKLSAICGMFRKAVILSDDDLQEEVDRFRANYQLQIPSYPVGKFAVPADGPTKKKICGTGVPEEMEGFRTDVRTSASECLFLFTSGSTGNPKGVGLTQKNVFARTIGEIQRYGFDENLRDFNWMTLTHAAGLVWSHIRDIYLDAFQIQADTAFILQNPLRMPEYMSRFRADTSWAPDFAFALIAEHIDPEKDYHWQLRQARYIFSTGEANVSRDLRAFLKKVSPYGFPENGLIPCFGMTETSSVMIYDDTFRMACTTDQDPYVPIGSPSAGTTLQIADAKGTVLKEGEIGFLQIKGETMLNGYYHNPEANRRSFSKEGFLITGDMGYIENGMVTLTGRSGDTVIINGLNYNTQDLEVNAEMLEGVATGCTAVIPFREGGSETVILFFSPEDDSLLEEENFSELKFTVKRLRREFQIKCGLDPAHIVPLAKKDFPRAGIAKKQRGLLRKNYSDRVYRELLNRLEDRKELYVLEKDWKEVPVHAAGTDPGYRIDRTFMSLPCCSADSLTRESLERSFESVLQSLQKYAVSEGARNILFPVITDPHKINPAGEILLPMLRSLALEDSGFAFKLVYLDEKSEDAVLREANARDRYEVVSYRSGKRYLPVYRTVQASCDRRTVSSLIDGGLTVLIGGMGGIGKILTGGILQQYRNPSVVLIGRREETDIGRELQAFHSDCVRYRAADLLDLKQLRDAIESAEAETGRRTELIVDLTAVPVRKEDERTIRELPEGGMRRLYTDSASARYFGAVNAEKIRSEKDALLYIFGSVTGEFGMPRMSAYACSNYLAGRYCEKKQEEKLRFLAFSGWNNIGMNRRKTSADMKQFLDLFNQTKNGFLTGFTKESGLQTADSIFCSPVRWCLAGVDRDFPGLQSSVDEPKEQVLQIVLNSEEELQTAEKALETIKRQYPGAVTFAIHKLQNAAAAGDLKAVEEKMVRLWETVLQSPIGDFDGNLFDLGGNSLTVFRLVEEIRDLFSEEIRPIDIMMYPTIHALSGYILQKNRMKTGQSDRSERKKPVYRKRRGQRG